MLIDTDQQFVAFLERCKKSPYIAIDTEFLRERRTILNSVYCKWELRMK